MTNLIEIQLENGTKIFIEANQLDVSDDLLENVSGNRIIKKTTSFLIDTFNQIKSFSSGIAETIGTMDIRPDELEVEFAIKFSADAGIIISSVGTEANITVKMKWEKPKGE